MASLLKRLVSKVSPSAVDRWGNSIFYGAGSTSYTWGNRTQEQFIKDFAEIPELNAVINYRAWAQSLVELKVVSKITNKEVSNSKPIVRVLKKPNYFQTQKELWRQAEIFRSIFGNEYNYFLRPTGMKNSFKALFTLPPQNIETKYPQISNPFYLNTEYPDEIRYEYTWQGRKYLIDPEDVLHMNDNNVNMDWDNYLEGNSKLIPLTANIKNIRSAYEARNVIIENRGAIGILSNNSKDGIGSTLPMDPKEKEKLQKEMEKYGMLKRQWRFILTNLSLKWTQITTDMDKLKLFEETKEDFKMICAVFGVPYELLAGGKEGLFGEDKEKAQVQFYQDTVIPATQERIQGFNEFLETENRSWQIVGTFDHLPIFQEDLRDRAETLDTLVNALNVALGDGAITVEDYRRELSKLKLYE